MAFIDPVPESDAPADVARMYATDRETFGHARPKLRNALTVGRPIAED